MTGSVYVAKKKETAMARKSMLVVICTLAACAMGCAMCCGPDMYTYPTHGGRIQRSDLEYGRVGSIYSDPLLEAGVLSDVDAVPPTSPRDGNQQPTPVEELNQSTTQQPPRGIPARPTQNRKQDGWR
jgi:hypothetical protein